MKYLMFVVEDPASVTEADREAAPDIEEWLADVTGSGKRVMGDRLRPVEDATTVRVRDGELLLTDGPFTESKECIVGFDVLECDDLDEALEIVARHPMAYGGSIEVRPFWPIDEG